MPDLPRHVDALVVGTGFGGLAALHRLRTDHPDLTVLAIERADGAGGVWRANDYPGAACDVPTSLYSLSFAPKPDWSHSYGRQSEIRSYLEGVAEPYADQIRYNCTLESAQWDGAQGEWDCHTSDGVVRARFLVAAPGALSAPGTPELPGIDEYTGTIFHSAQWNHEHDLRGRRVAVIGSGASAIQIVPDIVDDVEHLTVFSRTPAWVIPRVDRPIGAAQQNLYRRFPLAHKLIRLTTYLYREFYVILMARHPRLLPIATAVAKTQLRIQVHDRTLRRELTPDYTIGCKRMLLSNKWFPALQRKNATVTGAITSLTADGAVDDAGLHHLLDTVILATGFTPTTPPLAKVIRGAGGTTLADAWGDSPNAYRGVSIHGFPNLFFLYGPNTNLGHSSIVLMLEAQAGYVSKAISFLRAHRKSVLDVTAEAQRVYNGGLDVDLNRTVWNNGGCQSWYIDASGRNSVMWPTFTRTYRSMMARFVARDYRITDVVRDDRSPALADLAAAQ